MIVEEDRKVHKGNFNNWQIYLLVCMFILAGVILGSLYFRHITSDSNLMQGLTQKFEKLKLIDEYSGTELYKGVIVKNIKILILFIVVGGSIIGSPFLLMYCAYKGFSVAVTIATIVLNFEFFEAQKFIFKSLFVHTTITFFAIVILMVSSLKVSLNVFKEKKDVKLEVIRHLIACIIATGLLLISSAIEILLQRSKHKYVFLT